MTQYRKKIGPGQKVTVYFPDAQGNSVQIGNIKLAAGDRGVVETTSVVVEPPPDPEPVPPPSGEQPPLIPNAYTATPSLPLPQKYQAATDPVYGTKVTRIGDAGMRHAYGRIQPWSPSEKYLYLYYPDDGTGSWLLDGKTYVLIKRISPPSGATWISDTEMVGANLETYNVESGARSRLPNAPTGSIGAGEGAPSDDFRYWAVLNGATVYVYDRTAAAVISTLNLGTSPNNVTMSRKGGYVIVQYSARGAGQTQGTWLFNRSGARVRQLWDAPHHMDPGVDAQGNEVAVSVGSGLVDLVDLASGLHRSLAKLPSVWPWVGHVTCRQPGWALCSPDSWHSPGNVGNDQLASFDMAVTNADKARVWAHEHCWSGATYLQQPQAVQSPSGGRVLFASMWTQGSGAVYPFVAER